MEQQFHFFYLCKHPELQPVLLTLQVSKRLCSRGLNRPAAPHTTDSSHILLRVPNTRHKVKT